MPRTSLAAFDLKAARKLRGLSQVKVAEILCTTQPSVARWEAQGNLPEVFRKVWELHWKIESLDVSKLEKTYAKAKQSNKRLGNADKSDRKLQRGSSSRIVERRRRSVRHSDPGNGVATSAPEVESASDDVAKEL